MRRVFPALRDLGADAVLDRASTDPARLPHFDVVVDPAVARGGALGKWLIEA